MTPADEAKLRHLAQAAALLDEHLAVLDLVYGGSADVDLIDPQSVLDAFGHTCSILFPHPVFSPNLHQAVAEFRHRLSSRERSVCEIALQIRNQEWGHFDEGSKRANPMLHDTVQQISTVGQIVLIEFFETEVPILNAIDGEIFSSVMRRLRNHLSTAAQGIQ